MKKRTTKGKGKKPSQKNDLHAAITNVFDVMKSIGRNPIRRTKLHKVLNSYRVEAAIKLGHLRKIDNGKDGSWLQFTRMNSMTIARDIVTKGRELARAYYDSKSKKAGVKKRKPKKVAIVKVKVSAKKISPAPTNPPRPLDEGRAQGDLLGIASRKDHVKQRVETLRDGIRTLMLNSKTVPVEWIEEYNELVIARK